MIDAVIICFNPDIERLTNVIDAVRQQVNAIWLVDNSDNPEPQRHLADEQVTHLPQQANIGIAAAQNVGIRHAMEASAQKILFLDQDSVMDANSIAELDRLLSEHNSIAAVGSNYRMGEQAVPSVFVRNGWFRFHRVSPEELDGANQCDVDFMISSGSLISKAALEAVGLMDERYFIDHVDTQWCLRARDKGYRLLGSIRSGMSHSLGERFVVIKLGRTRFIPYHKPFRYYYIYRNSIWLYREPYTPLKFISADIVRLISILFICVLATEERGKSIKMVWKGIKDGFTRSTKNAPIPVESHG